MVSKAGAGLRAGLPHAASGMGSKPIVAGADADSLRR